MKRALVVLAATLACTACSKAKEPAEYARIVPPPGAGIAPAADAAAAPAADAAASPVAMEPASPPPDGSTAMRIAAGPPMLAYSYSYGLSLPHGHVDALRRRHEQACVKAGYRICQVVSTSIQDHGAGNVTGELVMRAVPAWMQRFRNGLEGDAKTSGGRIETSDVTSEDLSREIVDTQAQLRAKLTLRDRLQALLANRPGRLADLLSVERELARVQAEIDSAQSQLTVMQARVAMSDVTINYSPNDVMGHTVRSPLARSVSGFFGGMAASVAAMIDIVAVAAPWLLLAGGALWFLRRRLPKLRRPFTKAAPAETA